MDSMIRRLAIVATLAFMPSPAWAQASATLTGTVRDAAGDAVPQASIVLTGDDAGIRREAQTGANGTFELPGLLTARAFELEVSAAGFATRRVTISGLAAGERRLLDVRLGVAGVAERVDVRVEGAIGRTTSPELGGHIEREQLARVPVNGRDLVSVAYLVPGAAPARGFYNLAPRLTINGSSSLATNYTVDGFDNTDLFLGGPKVPVTLELKTSAGWAEGKMPQ